MITPFSTYANPRSVSDAPKPRAVRPEKASVPLAVMRAATQTRIMDEAQSIQPSRRAAIFVDFDNVYTGLRKLDEVAAEHFATDPGGWSQHLVGEPKHGVVRRFLVRNCYLNPSVYSKYRAQWTRAGYRVIDCPSLTQQGKSSTDINLVLDAVDLLSGASPIDEFILASADADFTSLIQRFRASDKFTTVIVAGAVASAYRLVADTVIESDELLMLLSVNELPGVEEVGTTYETASEAAGVVAAKSKGLEPSSPALEKDRPPIETQVSRATGIPTLSTDQFRQLFISLARQLRANTHASLNGLVKQVRDDTVGTENPVSRAAVAFVVQGLVYSNFKFTPTATASALASASAKNSEALSRGARMEFTDRERSEVMRWVSGGFFGPEEGAPVATASSEESTP